MSLRCNSYHVPQTVSRTGVEHMWSALHCLKLASVVLKHTWCSLHGGEGAPPIRAGVGGGGLWVGFFVIDSTSCCICWSVLYILTSSSNVSVQTGYNLLYGCWKYSWDADCELFLKILRGEVKEEVYVEQIQLQVILLVTHSASSGTTVVLCGADPVAGAPVRHHSHPIRGFGSSNMQNLSISGHTE